eukprot:gene11323-21514_t
MANQVPSIEGQDPLKVVVSMMEKKVRNLEKRKTKLVTYTKQVQSGQELVEKEQEDAVKKLEYVENNLELAKEFQGIFKSMEQEHQKLQKKEQKRAKVEMKEKNNEERKSLVVQVLEVQAILENLDGDVKEDFVNGTKGAVKLAEDEFAKLDGIYKLITPLQNEDTEKMSEQDFAKSQFVNSLTKTKDKEIYGIVKKIKDSKYFEKAEEDEAPTQEADSQEEQTGEQAEASTVAAESEVESAPTLEHTATGQVEVRGSEVYTEVPSDHAEQTKSHETEAALLQESSVVNGVDLPSEFSEAVADSALNFMGESEVQSRVPSGEEGKLNAASPEFIPRSLQGVPSQDPSMNAQEAGMEDAGEWPDAQHQHHGGRRGGPRGRDRGGFRGGRDSRGGRGRGGFGQNGSNYYRQDRPEHRRDGGRGAPRGGNLRGNRGGPRGSGRGGPSRGGSARGHHQQQQQ